MDEPTNDLDVEMLEVLEQRLVEYSGTLILVSHDRDFLDNVVTSTLVFEDNGMLQEYLGGYQDWVRRGKHLLETDTLNPTSYCLNNIKAKDKSKDKTSKKLSYNLQRELNELPAKIESLEKTIQQLTNEVEKRNFYELPYEKSKQVLEDLTNTQGQLNQALERWEELERML